jgi:hypothetical protein
VDNLEWNVFVFHVALGEVRVTDVKDIQAARDGVCGRFVGTALTFYHDRFSGLGRTRPIDADTLPFGDHTRALFDAPAISGTAADRAPENKTPLHEGCSSWGGHAGHVMPAYA